MTTRTGTKDDGCQYLYINVVLAMTMQIKWSRLKT